MYAVSTGCNSSVCGAVMHCFTDVVILVVDLGVIEEKVVV